MDDDGDRTALGTYSASWLGDSCKQRWDSIKKKEDFTSEATEKDLELEAQPVETRSII
ncbi:hypothetical protein MtrunA17_Chr3g0088961 [Medicago truncatula]|uniref:Uncharacterized protein n=1 Tax=Medicago truncatula TaxID=3880 RepID=A0A396IL42_MEDTR|nr:hypothetical protein MtrunA17_Chr3g0088961 [Medicago truncatula]